MAKLTKKEISEILEPLKNHTILKDAIAFKEDVHIKGGFAPDEIAKHYMPELSGKKKWVFKKNLIIDGNLKVGSIGSRNPINIEVQGDTKVNENILIPKASVMFRSNLDVSGYIITPVVDQCGYLPKFNCNGIVKATFLSTNSKINIKGTFHPDTLLIVPHKYSGIEGYDCHDRARIKRDYWTKDCIEEWKKYGRGFIWLDYDKILEDMKAGRNIFTEE